MFKTHRAHNSAHPAGFMELLQSQEGTLASKLQKSRILRYKIPNHIWLTFAGKVLPLKLSVFVNTLQKSAQVKNLKSENIPPHMKDNFYAWTRVFPETPLPPNYTKTTNLNTARSTKKPSINLSVLKLIY